MNRKSETRTISKGATQFLRSITDAAQISQWLKTYGQCSSLAMVGRSNVGKSTLINALFGKGTARVSKSAGSTRAINVFQFEIQAATKYLYDLPGHGHARISKAMRQQWDELMDTYFRTLGKTSTIVNIQDARHPMQTADQELHRYLRPLNLPVVLVFNKLDKLKTQRERFQLEQSKKQILKDCQWVREIFYLSAHLGEGVDELQAWLAQEL